MTHDTEIVSALQAALSEKVGRERYDLWFSANAWLTVECETLRVRVRNKFYLEWLRTNFRSYLEEVCQEKFGKAWPIAFEVDPQFAQSRRAAQSAEAAPTFTSDTERNSPAGRGTVQQADAEREATKASSEAGGAHPASSDHGARGFRTAALRNGPRRFASLDSFICGTGNRIAVASATETAHSLGVVSPLVLYGPTGVGKTHLLEGIWTTAKRGSQRLQAVYLTAEQFTSLFLDALNSSGLPNFRHKYRGVDLLLIDDLQFFSGKRATLNELLHTIDTLRRAGRQLVFAADRPPASLTGLGKELITRLTEGLVCRVDGPDQDVRQKIVAQRSADLGLHMPADVAQFVANSFRTNVREIIGAVHKLHATSRALNAPVTLALAQAALAETVGTNHRAVKLADVQQAVCDVFGLEPQSLCSGQRATAVSHPRMLAMYLARKYTRAGLAEIGQFFGNRSHTTVISANKKIDQWMSDAKILPMAGNPMQVDEAIRRVEVRLLG